MGDQFVLRWHCHEPTLMKNLPCLLDSELLTDVTISVGQQDVRAHRLVLATCSTYFLDLFQRMEPLHHPVLILHNANFEDIKAVLSFMYKGHCIVSKKQLPSLLSLAKLLKIQGLCDMKLPFDDANKIETPKTDENRSKNMPLPSLQTLLTPPYSKLDLDPTSETVPIAPVSGNEPTSPVQKRPQKDNAETCKCFLCGKYLSNQYNLRVHMETHDEAYHACHSCPHVSRSKDALRKHVSYRHPQEYLTRKRKKTEDN